MRSKWLFLLLVIMAGVGEGYATYHFYSDFTAFPVKEFYLKFIDAFLRDLVLLSIAALLYFRRKRIPDRTRRYFPVVVTGILYLSIAVFMVQRLSLHPDLLTTLAVLAGLNNNIFLLLVVAMCYHKWLGWQWKLGYFLVYLYTNLTLVFDAFYFWQTSMHVESVLFQNLNFYAAKGVLSSMGSTMLGCILAGMVLLIALFRVSEPTRHKPNFVWSLMCVALVTLVLNISSILGCFAMMGVENLLGVYAEADNEKGRQEYRDLLAVPMNLNFAWKAAFDTDKLAGAKHVEQRALTAQDKKALAELGIEKKQQSPKLAQPAYDKVVLLVLESVHRDYFAYYNPNIPQGTTPFVDSLLTKYPHLDRYYASAIPTTQGLNAMFRSHVILDQDVPGRINPSLYTSVQQAGMRGIFLNASSQYYAKEIRKYPEMFGMSEYYAKEYLEKKGYTGASGWGLHNDEMYRATLEFLDKSRKDRMLLVTKTLDMHQPYPYAGLDKTNIPEVEVSNSPYATIRGMYWVDQSLQHFFAEVEKRGLMDERTLFIITSDHNPHNGGEYKELVTKADDKLSIAPLPLLFISKNTAPLQALRTQEYASQIDLAPTLLYLLGLDIPEKFMGRNLLQPVEIPYALGYFGGKAFYWSDERHFVDQMDKEIPENIYEDALSNYLIHVYGQWHEK